jgi:hypothetical protein
MQAVDGKMGMNEEGEIRTQDVRGGTKSHKFESHSNSVDTWSNFEIGVRKTMTSIVKTKTSIR